MLSLLSVLTLTFPFGAFGAMPDVSSVIGSVDKDAQLIKVGDVTPLSSSEVNSYVPYGWFASAAYCPPKSRDNWQCKSCQEDSVKDFQLYKYGGDGDKEQYWYVGWWPSHNSVVVGRQGTDFEKLYAAPPLHCVPRQLTFVDSSWPVITDVTLVQVPTDRFPMCPNEATIHLGFLESHKRSIDSISGAVEDILKEHHGAQVITVGHSLGAALATLDGMYMKQKLGYNVEVITRTFGGPRVGNKAFADCVDATIPDFVRITNKRDPIPILPPVISGYHHPSGEKHINLEGMWHNCAGQENLNKNCSVGEAWVNVPYWFEHDGPYAGGAQTRQDANC
ncbi:unnamed protein product [Rhizoctonia solani]|uniref:Fungal lipase-type domain-containing protein n=1 Tax=Rhizoctonia solani TaxID=456999 RepID=A0A8H3GJ74_9AGAM|nr:unnamed protein product [Rhizoctonia solani]